MRMRTAALCLWMAALGLALTGQDRPYQEQKGGKFEEQLSAGEAGVKTVFLTSIPQSYSPSKAWPLIVFMHGGDFERPGVPKSHAAQIRGWFRESVAKEYIVAVPITPEGFVKKSWRKVVFATIARVKQKYRIDVNRIYLGGGSMGAFGAWETCLFYGDRFAGLISCAGGYGYDEYLESTINLPVVMAHGMKDKNTQPENSQINYDALKALGYPVKFYKYPDDAHALPYWEIIEKSTAWFADKPRNPDPKKVVYLPPDTRMFKTTENIPMRNYWMEVLEVEGKHPRIEADIKNNKVTVTAKSIKKIKLFFNDKLVDFDKPVEIAINGQVVKNEKVAKDPKGMADFKEDFEARGLSYSAFVTLNVPAAKQ